MDYVVLKLGGSLITEKEKDIPRVREDVLERLAREISAALREDGFRLVIVHGAGPFGHKPAAEYKLKEGLKDSSQAEGVSITHSNMESLNASVVSSLRSQGLPATAFQPSSCGVLDDGRLVEFPDDIIKRFMDAGIVPVGYGDVLVDKKLGVSILSGDQLAAHLARALNARLVIATDYNGIYTGDPKETKSERIPRLSRENLGLLDGRKASGTDVTGGIKGKVFELLELADEGLSSQIISGLKKDYVKRALLGEDGVGTTIS